MRIFAGVVAATHCEFVAVGSRIVAKFDHGTVLRSNKSSTRALAVVTDSGKRTAGLEKQQPDQGNDRDPGDHIRRQKAGPEPASGRIVPLQHTAVCMFSDHRRLPGRRFQDKRLASYGLFNLAELGDHQRTCGTSNVHSLR
jgi:hypothetical protein